MLPGFNFNSRPRVGGDTCIWLLLVLLVISIHAPAWGATDAFSRHAYNTAYFNSRPRVGGDTTMTNGDKIRSIFQFTPPRGGRQLGESRYCEVDLISIHAPAWGATYTGDAHPRPSERISIHAPAWGAT